MDFGGKTVAVDFDGVLHSYERGWTGSIPTDPPNDGAVNFIQCLLQAHARVVIFTTRAAEAEGYAGIMTWLTKWGFPPLEVVAEKPVAIAYVDDRAVRFQRFPSGRGNWNACLDEIEALAHARQHGQPG